MATAASRRVPRRFIALSLNWIANLSLRARSGNWAMVVADANLARSDYKLFSGSEDVMQKRRLGNSPLEIASVVFGGNVFGWTVDEPTAFRLLDSFLDAGFNAIDTADSYSR